MTEQNKMDGIELESVGTFLRNDGQTFPMMADGTVGMYGDDDEGTNIRDIDPDGEGEDWWANLSPADRIIVEKALNSEGERN